ncbi:MAG: carboxyl transferase domain-containing protein, partial [Acidimicrobiia bacterium]
DACVAWPRAEIAVMGAAAATQLLHGRKGVSPDDLAVLEEEYRAEHCTPAIALKRGYIDEVIAPAETRQAIWGALRSLQRKREHLPKRKHSLTPL